MVPYDAPHELTLVLTSGQIDPFSIFLFYIKIWDVEVSAENMQKKKFNNLKHWKKQKQNVKKGVKNGGKNYKNFPKKRQNVGEKDMKVVFFKKALKMSESRLVCECVRSRPGDRNQCNLCLCPRLTVR